MNLLFNFVVVSEGTAAVHVSWTTRARMKTVRRERIIFMLQSTFNNTEHWCIYLHWAEPKSARCGLGVLLVSYVKRGLWYPIRYLDFKWLTQHETWRYFCKKYGRWGEGQWIKSDIFRAKLLTLAFSPEQAVCWLLCPDNCSVCEVIHNKCGDGAHRTQRRWFAIFHNICIINKSVTTPSNFQTWSSIPTGLTFIIRHSR